MKKGTVAIIAAFAAGLLLGSAAWAQQAAKFSLSSSAFHPGAAIPKQYTCSGANASPDLSWSNAPGGTESFAMTVTDPDAPGRVFTHWVMYNIPASAKALPAVVPKDQKLADGSFQGLNDLDSTGYYGPCPPPGNPHRYFFRLYALNAKLTVPPMARRADLEKAIAGHAIGTAELMGTFAR
jgi:Raf kinase inhibitor-like YbhB/YbcL family protein